MPASFRPLTACLVTLLAAAPAGAQLYKWVDDNGTVNYSNTPPAKTKGGKSPTVVEDRTSVYTPEKSVTDALDRRRLQPPPPPPVASAPLGSAGAITPSPPPPPNTYDPCAVPGDPNCQGYVYGGPPVYGHRRPLHDRPIPQPHLPPGTIAGQSTAGGGVIPGLSGVTPPAPVQRPVRDREIERTAPFRGR